jgi:hypothetical protein
MGAIQVMNVAFALRNWRFFPFCHYWTLTWWKKSAISTNVLSTNFAEPIIFCGFWSPPALKSLPAYNNVLWLQIIISICPLGMHRILILPDIRPTRYPANLKAGYRISGAGRIPDIRCRPDTGYPAGF